MLKKKEFRIMGVFLLATLAGILCGNQLLRAISSLKPASDFNVYYTVANSVFMLARPEHPYVNFAPLPAYIYQPGSLILIAPLPLLPYYLAKYTWALITLGSLIASIYLIIKMFFKKNLLLFWFSVGAFSLFYPFRFTIRDGQFNGLLLLIYSAGLYFLNKKKNIAAGILLGLGVVTKVSPAIIIVYEMIKRNFKLVAASAVIVIGLGLIAEVTVQPGINYYYVRHVLKGVSGQSQRPSYRDQSLLNTLKEFDLPLMEDLEILQIEITPDMQRSLINYGIVFLIFAAFTYVSYRRKFEDSLLYDYSFVMILGIIGTGLAWYHHYTMLILPLLVIFYSGVKYREKKMGKTLIAFGVLLFIMMYPSETVLGNLNLPSWFGRNNLLLGAFLMMGILYYIKVKGLKPTLEENPEISVENATKSIFAISIVLFLISIALVFHKSNWNERLRQGRDVGRMTALNYTGTSINKYSPKLKPGTANSFSHTHKLDEGYILMPKGAENKVREALSILLIDPINNEEFNFEFTAYNEEDFKLSARLESDLYIQKYGEIYTIECLEGECVYQHPDVSVH